MTTRSMIEKWFEEARVDTSHMLIVCDKWDFSDYPVYTSKPRADVGRFNSMSMQHVVEVYDLRKDMNSQLDSRQAWNF